MSELYLVGFKGSRKSVYLNPDNLPLKPNDYVIVQAERGEDLGRVIIQIQREDLSETENKPLNILRKAIQGEIERLSVNREKEKEALKQCKRMVFERNMEMKLVDSEFQFDCNKITFYFTADERVDFRELVKELASLYKTRIELRQIGVRDEAKRMDGYGCCGLRLCCSTYLKDFEPITTQLAKEQNLTLTPSKISGNCGRLLCCLLYEKEFYEKILPSYPKLGSKFTTEKGEGTVEKINIFKEYIIIKYEDGEEEKITLVDLKKKSKKGLGLSERLQKS